LVGDLQIAVVGFCFVIDVSFKIIVDECVNTCGHKLCWICCQVVECVKLSGRVKAKVLNALCCVKCRDS
jgi:hypothetical protein